MSESGESEEEKIVLADGHCNLHMELLKKATIHGGKDTPVGVGCRARMVEAIALMERVDEVSCGMWEIFSITPGSHWAAVDVELRADFLEKIGIVVRALVNEETPSGTAEGTTIVFPLGCRHCAFAFVEYCRERWGQGKGL